MWTYFDKDKVYPSITYVVCYDGLERDTLRNYEGRWYGDKGRVSKDKIFRIRIPCSTIELYV